VSKPAKSYATISINPHSRTAFVDQKQILLMALRLKQEVSEKMGCSSEQKGLSNDKLQNDRQALSPHTWMEI
jgi:hypothetical protein